MTENVITNRQTKYCKSIEDLLLILGHATNAEILVELRKSYPNLSATTVHRATTRLSERNKISIAPSTKDGSTRYDINTKPHDHFHCTSCEELIDTDIKEKIIPIIESSIIGCNLSGRLTINGICKKCNKEKI